LSRLASKPGVQSTLVLSKADGSIIRSSGLLAAHASPTSGNVTTESGSGKPIDTPNGDNDYGSITDSNSKGRSAEAVARIVFSFVSAARDFAEAMDDGDGVKLLRLRTRKNEIVIVPGQLLLNNETSKYRFGEKISTNVIH